VCIVQGTPALITSAMKNNRPFWRAVFLRVVKKIPVFRPGVQVCRARVRVSVLVCVCARARVCVERDLKNDTYTHTHTHTQKFPYRQQADNWLPRSTFFR
jgi:hypothetical protein